MNLNRLIRLKWDVNNHQHLPVLQDEILQLFSWKGPISSYADLTLGGGGHLKLLLEAAPLPKRIIAFDRDLQILERTRSTLSKHFAIEYFHENFDQFAEKTSGQFDRIFLDLGVSSFQLDDSTRGFSFQRDGPLDMRMDPSRGQSAWEWLESVEEKELADVLYRFGEEGRSRVHARKLVHERQTKEIRTTKAFVEALGFRLDSKDHHGKHPLTRVFQGIRIFINDELGSLERCLESLPQKLAPGGRLAIISFHSLEDRAVKWSLRGKLAAVNKKVIQANKKEMADNPRARSAKLRIYEKNEA
ncbi:MAG: 16S rRNA (cytosine(1402)-N(4))-methyltransferase [Deltaproteobacteria bacterium CG11_big_fil_rev_8_21_14_0_20_45_16]|nr:MAG: 16S rRNA (cytosine(1402)-N(4))-methyltransferase [Deltaproteobacteria bacterium CG11_big_fil_rev_8_21_14_0_20_45_16]